MALWPLSRATRRTPIERRAENHIESVLARRPAVLAHGGEVVRWREIPEGSNSEIWRVDLDRGALIARFWKVESNRNKASEHVHLLRVLAEMNMPTPRLIDSDLSDATAQRHGFRVTVEECLEGRHLAPDDLAVADVRHQLVSILSRLHHDRRVEAGRPWRRFNEEHPWGEWISRRIDVLVDRVCDLQPGEEAVCQNVRRALGHRQPPMARLVPFNLLHGDVQPANYLLGRDRQLRMIDFGAMTHGPFEMDLVGGEDSFEYQSPGCFQSVLRDYFAAVPREWRQRHSETVEFFRAFHHLSRAVSAWRKASKPKYADRRAVLAHRAERHWQQLTEIV